MSEKTITFKSPIRINKYLCGSGICSRKAADIHIKNGVVYINGQQARLGDKVSFGDKVTVDGSLIEPLPVGEVIVIALNKPVGIVCTASKNDTRNVVDFVAHESRIFPVGRLDKDSQGLILLTNRAEWVDKILRADNHHEKEYLVTVDKEISDDFIAHMSGGVPMLGVVTKKCSAVKESTYVFRIILVQGLNRQIRRMCKHFGYAVVTLRRTRVMHIKLNDLAVGQWRELSADELSVLGKL